MSNLEMFENFDIEEVAKECIEHENDADRIECKEHAVRALMDSHHGIMLTVKHEGTTASLCAPAVYGNPVTLIFFLQDAMRKQKEFRTIILEAAKVFLVKQFCDGLEDDDKCDCDCDGSCN